MSIITIRVSCMVTEIWSLNNFGVTTLTFLRARDVIVILKWLHVQLDCIFVTLVTVNTGTLMSVVANDWSLMNRCCLTQFDLWRGAGSYNKQRCRPSADILCSHPLHCATLSLTVTFWTQNRHTVYLPLGTFTPILFFYTSFSKLGARVGQTDWRTGKTRNAAA